MLLYGGVIWSPIFKFLTMLFNRLDDNCFGNLVVAFRGFYVWTFHTASTPANTTIQVLVQTNLNCRDFVTVEMYPTAFNKTD